jgi:sugar-specific transcriptional regulator TrmB
MSDRKVTEALTQLGLNQLEAEVYRFLISEHPASGYRVSQGISKPTANVYKALESLLKKGAVLQVDHRKKSYSPVEPEKLFARVEKQFHNDKAAALKEFARISAKFHPSVFTPITSEEQLVSFARRALEDFESSVAICSGHYSKLLEESFDRTYLMSSKMVVARTLIIVPEGAFEAETLQIVSDRTVAVFGNGSGQCVTGFSVDHPSFAAQLHQSVTCQIGLYQVDQALEADQSRKQISRLIENLP